MKILHVFTLATTAEAFFDGQFRYLSDAGYNIIFIAATNPAKDFCERNSVDFHRVDIARRIDILADIKSIRELTSYIKSGHFDAVIGHTPKGAMVAMIAARLTGMKNRVYYRHGLIYTTATGIKRFILKSVERFTSALATKIVNVSSSLSHLAAKDRLNSDRKQYVIGNGTCGGIDAIGLFNPQLLPTEDLASLHKSLIGEADFVVGFCGRLCKDKGIAELVDGFNLFQELHPEIKAKLLLVGPFDERDILAGTTKAKIKRNPAIIATGRQDKSKLPALYALMDVFVFPSYREGFGMCVLEASAMEVPILVSRSHGCVDSIKENVTGQYIEISPESIASGLSDMLDVDLRNRLGKSGRQFVLNNFDHKVMWPLIKQFYDETFFNRK